ncbi:MAG: hypothetical protein WB014_06120 [Methanosarcina sp.]
MRVRRVATEKDFRSELRKQANGFTYFPVFISDVQKKHFGRIIDRKIAELKQGDEIEWQEQVCKIPNIEKHGIVSISSDITADLAMCYAKIGRRPFKILPPATNLQGDTSINDWESATVIMEVNVDDPFRTLMAMLKELRTHLGPRMQISFLVAESLEILSWLLLKQLIILKQSERYDVSAPSLLIDQITSRKYWGQQDRCHLSSEVSEIFNAMEKPIGVLFLTGHSRYHCGLLTISDGLVGICGSPTKGENELCFNNKRCFLESRPKIPIEHLQVERIFYNGCSTVKFSDSPFGVPKAANLALASLRGSVSQFIGNYLHGNYLDLDIFWFIALSKLKYPPAAAVSLIQRIRQLQLRQCSESLIFIGDAATPPWPTYTLPSAEIKFIDDRAFICWPEKSFLLTAKLPGVKWAKLAEKDQLDVITTSELLTQIGEVSIIGDEAENATIILMLIPGDNMNEHNFTLTFSQRKVPIDRTLGFVLASAIKEISFLIRYKIFSDVLTEKYHNLIHYLIGLRRISLSKMNILALEKKLEAGRILEYKMAASIDIDLVDIACERTISSLWGWEEEYADDVWPDEKVSIYPCPICGKLAYQYIFHYLADEEIGRRQTICVECGLVADLPLWQIEARLMGHPFLKSDIFCDTLELINRGSEQRFVVAKLRVKNFHDIQPYSEESVLIDLPPHTTVRKNLRLKFLRSISGFYWIRVYLASLGGFGFVSRPFIF